MKKFLFPLLLLLPGIVQAQDELEWKPASKESEAYHDYRTKITVPPYGLARVQDLIEKTKFDDENEIQALEEETYQALSLRERFTYNMIHAESFSQNCDIMPPIQDEQKKIFAQLPDAFNEMNWSERQDRFFMENRDSVVALIKESVERSGRMGINYKHVIVNLNAWDMIPFLVDACRKIKRDHDILTVLLLLMKENKFEPFLESQSYRKLYSEEANYESWINYNIANEDLIIERAMAFYHAQ